MLERTLRWVAAALGVAAAAWLPALAATIPFLPAESWSVRDLVHASTQHSLTRLLQDARRLGVAAHAGPHVDAALRWAAAIPAMAVAAGACAALLFVLQFFRPTRGLPTFAVAGVGLACSAYAIGAAWWLTYVARHALGGALARLGPALRLRDWSSVAHNLQAETALRPAAGLYVMCLAFAVLLLLPPSRPAASSLD